MSLVSISGGATGTGTVTLLAPVTNTDRTLTLPDATGTVLTTATPGVPVNGPAFSAYRSTSQSISAGTFTKIQFETEEFDTNSCYDNTTNYRFTPTVVGYYQVNGQVTLTGYANRATVYLYKNGANVRDGLSNTGNATNDDATNICALVYLNGSTDYIELYVQGNNALTANGGVGTYFQAYLARSAT